MSKGGTCSAVEDEEEDVCAPEAILTSGLVVVVASGPKETVSLASVSCSSPRRASFSLSCRWRQWWRRSFRAPASRPFISGWRRTVVASDRNTYAYGWTSVYEWGGKNFSEMCEGGCEWGGRGETGTCLQQVPPPHEQVITHELHLLPQP